MEEGEEKASEALPSDKGGRAFLLAVGAGVLFLLPKFGAGTADLPRWLLILTILGPILVMGLFWAHGARSGRMAHADTRQRLGDNVYFLGFIFTMTSLVMAFLPAAFADIAGIGPADIYAAFGTALVATAIGLIGRVIITQTGGTAEDVAVRVEEDLTALAREVATESRLIIQALRKGREAAAAHSEAVVRAVLDETATRIGQVATQFAAATDAVGRRLEAHVEDTNRVTDALRHRLEARTEDLSEAARTLAGAHFELGRAMGDLQRPVEQLAEELAGAARASVAAAQSLRADVRRVTEVLARVAAGGERLGTAIGVVEAGAGQVAEGLTAAITTVIEAADRAVEKIDGAVGDFRTKVGQFGSDASQFGIQAERFRVDLENSTKLFETAVLRLARELERIGSMPMPGGSRSAEAVGAGGSAGPVPGEGDGENGASPWLPPSAADAGAAPELRP